MISLCDSANEKVVFRYHKKCVAVRRLAMKKIRQLVVLVMVVAYLFSSCASSISDIESPDTLAGESAEIAEESPAEEPLADSGETDEETSAADAELPETDTNVQSELDDLDAILTVDNCEDLKAIIEATDIDIEKQTEFVSKYEGRIIEFNALVLYISQEDPSLKTIYTYIFVPGEDTEHFGSTLFLLRNASAMFDFHWDKETRPDSLVVGSKLRIQAEIIAGDNPKYIYIRPTYTWGR